MNSLGEDLRKILPRLGDALMSRDGSEAVLAVADCLPAGLARTFGLGCPLGQGPAQPDFQLIAARKERERGILGAAEWLGALGPVLPVHPAWQGIRRFAAAWADPGTILHQGADDIRLEFALDAPPAGIPVPSPLFGLRPRAWELEGDKNATTLALLDAGHRAVRGGRWTSSLRVRLLAILEALPPEGTVFQAGFLLARQDQALRLCVSGLGPEAILPFLLQAGWTGSVLRLTRLLELVAGCCNGLGLDFEVAEGLEPRLGLECSVRTDGPSRSRAQWEAFLGRLVDRSLCLDAERAALLELSGTRTLSHVKLALEPSAPPIAKACLTLAGSRVIRPASPRRIA